jgi:zinc D-Ala-D-Ala dipeptidase
MDPMTNVQQSVDWHAIKSLPIEECGEPLVNAGFVPDRLIVHPEYFVQNVAGALPEVWLRESVLLRLLKAADNLPNGHRFVLLDGWRPLEVQQSLYAQYRVEVVSANPDISDARIDEMVSRYVSPPTDDPHRPSPHLTGGSIDLTIVDESGIPLSMGTAFDETSICSHTTYYETSDGHRDPNAERYRANRQLLVSVMGDAGFSNYPDEWWHFDYGNQNWAYFSGYDTAIYGRTHPVWRWRSPR